METLLLQLPWESLVTATLLVVRIGAFVAVAPVFGSELVSVRVRAALVLLLVVLLAPFARPAADDRPLLLVVSSEMVIGLLIGWAARIVTEMALTAGMLLGLPTGLSMAQLLDPLTQSQTQVLGVFYQLLSATLFLAIGGHAQILAGLAHSYDIVPLGGASLAGPWLSAAIALTGRVIVVGLRLAAPVLVAGLLTDVALMLVARAVPQMNVLAVGAPIRLICGLSAISFSLHVLAPLISSALEGSLADLARMLSAMAPGN